MRDVEALSLGVPAIVSDLAVFREFAGEMPEYVDPLDGARWMALIEEYGKPMSTLRLAQLDRLASYRPPTWAQHMQRVDEFLALLEFAASGLGNEGVGVLNPQRIRK